MAEFTAKDVQALRNASGAGMMDAKRALTEADGDTEAAMKWLRERGLGKAAERYPIQIAVAAERLLSSGIAGPYGLALGREQYRIVAETAEHGGYPLLEHLRKILEGPIVWAPGVDGAIVLSLRGGDFVLESGQDHSIGYDSHDGEVVRLYLEQSFSFHVATPEAAVALKP